MIHVLLSCEGDRPSQFDPRCARYEATIPPEQAAQWMADRLLEHGWTSIDGKNYCPRHNPADSGLLVDVYGGVEYGPLGDTGWEARVPGMESMGGVRIEIRPIRGEATDA
jgi:hypothetical protein